MYWNKQLVFVKEKLLLLCCKWLLTCTHGLISAHLLVQVLVQAQFNSKFTWFCNTVGRLGGAGFYNQNEWHLHMVSFACVQEIRGNRSASTLCTGFRLRRHGVMSLERDFWFSSVHLRLRKCHADIILESKGFHLTPASIRGILWGQMSSGTTHSDRPEVGGVIQAVDRSGVQAQVVVFAEVPIQLQLLCGTQTMWLLFKRHLFKAGWPYWHWTHATQWLGHSWRFRKHHLLMMVVCYFLHGQSRANFTWRFKWATQMHLKCTFAPSSKHHFNTAKAHTAANITPEDQMALLKAPLSSSKEIHSSCGCMCQISLVPALASAESSPTDVCVLWSPWPLYCAPVFRT